MLCKISWVEGGQGIKIYTSERHAKVFAKSMGMGNQNSSTSKEFTEQTFGTIMTVSFGNPQVYSEIRPAT